MNFKVEGSTLRPQNWPLRKTKPLQPEFPIRNMPQSCMICYSKLGGSGAASVSEFVVWLNWDSEISSLRFWFRLWLRFRLYFKEEKIELLKTTLHRAEQSLSVTKNLSKIHRSFQSRRFVPDWQSWSVSARISAGRFLEKPLAVRNSDTFDLI